MNKKEKIWALLVHLSMNLWPTHYDELQFDDDFWTYILENAIASGYNTIVLDVGDGIEFASHPEIATKGAWTRKRVREEVKRCKELGITLIPKLNFATGHCQWLGKYFRMISTEEYYHVCRDLINEVYTLFDKPEYIHLGMDEEDVEHAWYNADGFGIFRHGKLYWHDLRFLVDCVVDTGAKPWMWYDPTIGQNPKAIDTERAEYLKHFDAKEVLLSPWHYWCVKENDFTPIADYEWDLSMYDGLELRYVEDIPMKKDFIENIVPSMDKGFEYVPCSWSTMNRNTYDLMEMFKDAPKEQYLGHMVSVWGPTTWENKDGYDSAFKDFKEAKEKFYPED